MSPDNSFDKVGETAVTAECVDAGEDLSAIGGGALLSTDARGSVAIVETRPTGLAEEVPTGWTASAVEINPISDNWTLRAYAVCAKVN